MTLRNRLALAALAAAVAACGSSTLKSTIVLSQPTSVAVFTGITSKNAGLHPYAAIANGARNDLTLVDALDDRPVLAPIVVRALAIPTAGRPALLVAGSLHDGGADLLVVIPSGSATLQLVRTWTADNQVVEDLDLSGDAPGAEVLSAISTPVPAADGNGGAEPGKVRLVLGLTGGRLAVLDFAREAGGAGIVAAAAPEVLSPGFDPLALSPTPGDARLIYAATTDDVPAGSGQHGVVEIAAGGAPTAWTYALLPTLAPTRLVAAVRVKEREWAVNDEEIPAGTDRVLRVFAALDPSGCGPELPIDCGIVTVDPSVGVRGLAPDPLGELPYQPPIRMPAEPLGMVAIIPPENQPSGLEDGRYHIQTGLGVREATGAIGVTAANGRVYTLDAGRRTLHNDQTMLRDLSGNAQTRTRAGSITYVARSEPKPPTTQILQVVVCTMIDPEKDSDPDTTGDPYPECKLDSTSDAVAGIRVTPGYTLTDSFNVSWQGPLPALNGRGVDVGREGAQLYAAVQVRSGGTVSDLARVYDPALGVHVGDKVELNVKDLLEGADACDVAEDPDTDNIAEAELDTHEFTVAALLPPEARFAGGALLLEDDGSACYAALRADAAATGTTAHLGMTATVRASGWLMKGDALGYAGRPVLWSERVNGDGQRDMRVKAELAYENEAALTCPLQPWPANPAAVACDAACRTRCERLSLARKARRWYTLADGCGDDADCAARWGGPLIDPDPDRDPATENPAAAGNSAAAPNTQGPALSFMFTVRERDTTDNTLVGPVVVNRDTGVVVSTFAGHSPTARYPLTGAIVLPTGIAAFDRSAYTGEEDAQYRLWVSYTGDLVLDFSPGLTLNTPITIR